MSATMEVKPKLEKKPVKFSNLLRKSAAPGSGVVKIVLG